MKISIQFKILILEFLSNDCNCQKLLANVSYVMKIIYLYIKRQKLICSINYIVFSHKKNQENWLVVKFLCLNLVSYKESFRITLHQMNYRPLLKETITYFDSDLISPTSLVKIDL